MAEPPQQQQPSRLPTTTTTTTTTTAATTTTTTKTTILDIDHRLRKYSGESFTSTGSNSTTKVVGSISGVRSVTGTMEDLQATGSFELLQQQQQQQQQQEGINGGNGTGGDHPQQQQQQSSPPTPPPPAIATTRSRDDDDQDNGSESAATMDEEIRMATAMALAIQNNPNLTPDEIHELLGQQTPTTAAPLSSGTAAAKKPGGPTSTTIGGGGPFRLSNMFATTMDDVNSSSSHAHRTTSTGHPAMASSASATPHRLVQGLADRARGRFQDIMQHATAVVATTASTSLSSATATSSAHLHHNNNNNNQNNHMSEDASEGSHSGGHGTLSLTTSSSNNNLSSSRGTTPLGMAWKRRGGLAKFTTTTGGLWERRYFCLLGPTQNRLVYYSTAEEAQQQQQNPSSSAAEPRGTIDLTQHSVTVTTGHSGAPTPFAISIKNHHGGETTKWKICCDSHKMQIAWLLQLSAATMRHSVDLSNGNLLRAAAAAAATTAAAGSSSAASSPPEHNNGVMAATTSAAAALLLDYTMYYPPAPGDVGGIATTKRTTSLWSLDADAAVVTSMLLVTTADEKNVVPTSTTHSDNTGPHPNETTTTTTTRRQRDTTTTAKTTTTTTAAAAAMVATSTTTSTTTTTSMTSPIVWTDADHAAHRVEVVAAAPRSAMIITSVPVVYLFWNVGAILARAVAFPQWFWYILMAGNVVLYHLVDDQARDWKYLVPHIYKAQQQPFDKAKGVDAVGVDDDEAAAMAVGVDPRATTVTTTARIAGQKIGRYIPVAGSSAIQLQNSDDPPLNAKGETFAGWRPVSGSLLKVRAHGYEKTKEKISSPGELYDCVAVDVFESPQRYPDMAPRVQLPHVQFEEDNDHQPADGTTTNVKTWRAPNIFIVSIALPTDPPKMGKSSSDGGGYTVTMYYRLKESTRELLRKVTAHGYDASQEDLHDPRVNAVRLWEEWIRRAPSDPKFMARFKVVPLAHNLAEIGMPGWISKYNGKPFLIKRAGVTGFIHTHPQLSCVEFDISLHPFPYLAKQGICFMKDSYFKRVLVTFGFVIEGRTDDELPEAVIGCMQLCYPDPQYAIQAKDFFNGSAPRSNVVVPDAGGSSSSGEMIETKKSTDSSTAAAVEDGAS